jgi:hypothetical protein
MTSQLDKMPDLLYDWIKDNHSAVVGKTIIIPVLKDEGRVIQFSTINAFCSTNSSLFWMFNENEKTFALTHFKN